MLEGKIVYWIVNGWYSLTWFFYFYSAFIHENIVIHIVTQRGKQLVKDEVNLELKILLKNFSLTSSIMDIKAK